jgi:plasmid stabilization system protein ParE
LAEIVYAFSALDVLERAFEYWVAIDPGAARSAASAISQAVEVLADHPLIARRVDGESRELVTSYSSTRV